MSELTPPVGPIDEQPSRLRGSLVRRFEAEGRTESDAEAIALEVGREVVSTVAELGDREDDSVASNSRVRSTVGRSSTKTTTPSSRVRSTVGISKASDSTGSPRDTIDITSERRLPTFDALRPESNVAKTYTDKEGAIDLRLSSFGDHQDGLAYNPDSDTVVVCDGLGGIGARGDVKDFFGFALAHAAAELEDISTLSDPTVVAATVARAKSILTDQLGITIEKPTSKVSSSMGGGFEWASTIAAVQRVPGTSKWKVATIGDSSVAVLGSDGRVRKGFGEAFQQIAAGQVESGGTAVDAPMGSLVGMVKTSFQGGVRYEKAGFGAEFSEVELGEGERLVVVSDAYVQKTNLSVLEAEAALSADQWKAKKPLHGDDTTMAVIAN